MFIKMQFLNNLNKAIKPLICICGKEYKDKSYEGGFVTDGVTYIWCCCKDCAEKTKNKLY